MRKATKCKHKRIIYGVAIGCDPRTLYYGDKCWDCRKVWDYEEGQRAPKRACRA